MKFWLDRGTDGFRMDVINHISKRDGLPDATVVEPEAPFQPPWEHAANGSVLAFFATHATADLSQAEGARVHQGNEPRGPLQSVLAPVVRRTELTGAEYDVITVGETPFTADPSVLVEYVLPENKELQMVFCFDHMYIDGPSRPAPRDVGSLGMTDTGPALTVKPWKLTDLKKALGDRQEQMYELNGWNSL